MSMDPTPTLRDGGPLGNGSNSPEETRERLEEAAQAARNAKAAQDASDSLRAKAARVADPKERQRMLQEAYDKEIEARGESAAARRMASGAWQGAAGGAGMGAGLGLGLGAVVGTLVGGLISLPTAGVGALVGTGVGVFKGPFIKINTKRREQAGGAGAETNAAAAPLPGQDWTPAAGKSPEQMTPEEIEAEQQHQAVIAAVLKAEEVEAEEARKHKGEDSQGEATKVDEPQAEPVAGDDQAEQTAQVEKAGQVQQVPQDKQADEANQIQETAQHEHAAQVETAQKSEHKRSPRKLRRTGKSTAAVPTEQSSSTPEGHDVQQPNESREREEPGHP